LSAIGDAGRWSVFAIGWLLIAAVLAHRCYRRKFTVLLPRDDARDG